jgi:hypothetical protein
MIDPRTIGLVVAMALAALALWFAYDLGSDKARLAGDLKARSLELAQEKAFATAMMAAKEQAEENLRKVNVANAQNAIQAREDQLAIEKLQEQINATPENPDRCLDRDAARRVRDIR